MRVGIIVEHNYTDELEKYITILIKQLHDTEDMVMYWKNKYYNSDDRYRVEDDVDGVIVTNITTPTKIIVKDDE